jgi:ribonuclease BN (tRNA processing enzyme)
MHVTPLGTGGAFDEYETCYLVNDSVLIDCGSSSIKRAFIFGWAEDITHVFLSHIHADHIGGFEALYYYRKYVLNKPINEVYCPGEFYKLAKQMPFLRYDSDKDFRFNYLANYYSNFVFIDTEFGKIGVQPFPVQHGNLEAYGFAIIDQATGKLLVISGDTDGPVNARRSRFDLMFHDIGWEGIPGSADGHKVHPREAELVEAFGAAAPIITIHNNTCMENPTYPRAEQDKVYRV